MYGTCVSSGNSGECRVACIHHAGVWSRRGAARQARIGAEPGALMPSALPGWVSGAAPDARPAAGPPRRAEVAPTGPTGPRAASNGPHWAPPARPASSRREIPPGIQGPSNVYAVRCSVARSFSSSDILEVLHAPRCSCQPRLHGRRDARSGTRWRQRWSAPDAKTSAMRTAPTADVSVQTILEYLRAGGATGLRASHGLVWVIGHAPSGVLIQILWRPELGYCVSRG